MTQDECTIHLELKMVGIIAGLSLDTLEITILLERDRLARTV